MKKMEGRMKDNLLEIRDAMYAGVCLYNRLKKTIVEINGEVVSIEDKKILGLYLGILHTQNSISDKLIETNLKKDTNIGYKCIDEYEYYVSYENCFKYIFSTMDFETIEDYFVCLLDNHIIKKLNREYNFNPFKINCKHYFYLL